MLIAFETIVVWIGILVLIIQVWKLVGVARKKFDTLTDGATDILDTVKDTAQTAAQTAKTAAGTAEFVADRTAVPVIELFSAVAGARRFTEALFRSTKNRPTGDES